MSDFEVFRKIFEEELAHVIKAKSDEAAKTVPDWEKEARADAEHIARMNRILYEAHKDAGFTSEESFALVVAQNN